MKTFTAAGTTLLLALTFTLPLSAQTHGWLESPDQEEVFLSVLHSISSHDLMDYVNEMSADKYRGRLSGTQEYMDVARWAAGMFEKWGIAPGGDDGGYLQMFDMPYSDMKNAGAVSIQMESGGEDLVIDYSFPDDYYPGTNSDAGTVTAELVYVGFGITAPELGYDDYEGMDVTGKIVVIDANTPYTGNDRDTTLQWVPYSYHQFKLDNAKRHGAAGLLYIGKLANPNTSFNEGLVYAHIDTHVADHLFFETGKTHDGVMEAMQASLQPASFEMGKTATIMAEIERHPEGRSANVVGVLEGSDPELKDEVIILGGHLDAVGYLGVVMPGALDNASGVADIMGAAKALSASPVRPKRTIVFLLIGGEECGLIGSTEYTLRPTFPKEDTVMFFNLDMVGHGTGLSVGGGLTYPDIYKHFEAANDAYLHRPLRTSEARVSIGRPRSDSVIFQRAGFRTMSFGTSGRVEGIPTYYHDPRDTSDTLTPEIMEDVVKLMFVGITGMANDRELEY